MVRLTHAGMSKPVEAVDHRYGLNPADASGSRGSYERDGANAAGLAPLALPARRSRPANEPRWQGVPHRGKVTRTTDSEMGVSS